MKHVFFMLLLFVSAFSISFAQTLGFRGTVFSKQDSSTVPFVHVHIENLSIGVVTNYAGQFHLILPDTLSNRNVVFSCIGFKSLSLPIREFLASRDMADSIFLIPDIVMLNEVVVEAIKQDSLHEFIQRVLEKVKSNYPTDDFFSSGFFRQISQNGDSSSRLVEAAISIQDPGYSGKDENVRVRVDQIRKSNDYVEYSWTKSLVQVFLGSENDLLKTYRSDFLRQSGKLIRSSSILTYNLRLDTILGTDQNQVAKIVFSTDEERNGPYFVGEIFVSLGDLAIRRMTYSWVANPKFTFPNQELVFFDNRLRFKIVVEYHKINSKYYPFYITCFEPIPGVTGAKGKLQFKESSIMINEILLKRSDYDRIKRREREFADDDIYEKARPYNKQFWETYNMVTLNPIGPNQRFSLEKKESLDNQFERNAKGKRRF
ncbi:MAG: carboxypeptidase-like regulatory domain-containing protein [Cyclobacteriaceae bacterium]|nr:carboxypeptidase-like regulatory domain-containing protein [Cyclobacteriaceae bacterium]